nr:metallopeptidase family protein [Streptomyces rimosus]
MRRYRIARSTAAAARANVSRGDTQSSPCPQFGRGHGLGVVTEGHFCVHEIAHHFGIDDERLHALGYG